MNDASRWPICRLAGKRVLIREDLNVPVKNGVVTSDARIVAALPTLERALQAGAAVMVVSHLGRPTEGESAATEPQHSLAPVAAHSRNCCIAMSRSSRLDRWRGDRAG